MDIYHEYLVRNGTKTVSGRMQVRSSEWSSRKVTRACFRHCDGHWRVYFGLRMRCYNILERWEVLKRVNVDKWTGIEVLFVGWFPWTWVVGTEMHNIGMQYKFCKIHIPKDLVSSLRFYFLEVWNIWSSDKKISDIMAILKVNPILTVRLFQGCGITQNSLKNNNKERRLIDLSLFFI